MSDERGLMVYTLIVQFILRVVNFNEPILRQRRLSLVAISKIINATHNLIL